MAVGEKVMPDQLRLGSPGQPLQTLIQVLGLSAAKLHIGEGPEELLLLERQFPTTAALQLTLPHVQELINWYGDALTFRLLLGERPVLTLEGFSASSLEDFQRDVAGSISLTLDLRLNKARCLERWGVPTASTLVKLFLFPEALARALSGSLLELETGLFRESTRRSEGCALSALARDCAEWRVFSHCGRKGDTSMESMEMLGIRPHQAPLRPAYPGTIA